MILYFFHIFDNLSDLIFRRSYVKMSFSQRTLSVVNQKQITGYLSLSNPSYTQKAVFLSIFKSRQTLTNQNKCYHLLSRNFKSSEQHTLMHNNHIKNPAPYYSLSSPYFY